MLINWQTVLILIIMAVSTISATKCGKYECHDNTECTFDEDKKEMNCICEKDFVTTFDKYNVYCCEKENSKCGPNHQCNKELQCEDLTEEIVMPEAFECANAEQRCEDKCCATDEICHEGKVCMAKEVKNENCPMARQCAEKCCKENESCSKDKKCIEKEFAGADIMPIQELCPAEKQCNGTCCNQDEICTESKICIDPDICPEAKQCFGKCCSEKQVCTEDKECVDEELAICSKEKRCNNKICCNSDELCWENLGCGIRSNCHDSRICLGKCCHENETCNEHFECIFQENPVTLDCPLKQQCNGKCCATNEICSESKICIDESNICPEAKQCFGKCCSEKQVCTEDKECVDVELAICSKEKRCNNKICCNSDELCWENLGCGNKSNCHDSRICLGKCCQANETCNEHFECIFQDNPVTLDCPLEQQCNGKCCATNEICFESECLEGSLNDNINMPECPKQQQCGEICCEANYVCSEDFKCLKRECLKCGEFCCKDKEICSEDLECLYDFPKKKPNNDFNAVLELYDFENSNTKTTQCPADHAPCRELCCQPHQFCNSLNQCEENPVATSDDDVEPHASLGYHSIGICCLVFAVGFSLFKIISACIGSQQYVLK